MRHRVPSRRPVLVFSKQHTSLHFHMHFKFQFGCRYIISLTCRDLTGWPDFQWGSLSTVLWAKAARSKEHPICRKFASSSRVPARTLSSGMLWFTKNASPFSDSARCNCAATLRTVDLQGASTVSGGQQRVPCMKTSY